MSEYQYYEFMAIDRPLSPKQMAELRALSTRAHITPVSFTNEYNWGDFKGDPDKLMQRYFDAHVYVANWMTAIFKVRLPKEAFSREMVNAFTESPFLEFNATPKDWIVTWCLEESEDYDRFGEEDGRSWMVRLAPIRDELLRGDFRSLYIGWLPAISVELLGYHDEEPLALSGLGNLTAAQKALAKFLEVEPDLLAGAGMGSPEQKGSGHSQAEMEVWIKGLSRTRVNEILKWLLAGQGREAERTLKNQFAEWQRGQNKATTEAPRRTVGELQANCEAARKIRLKQQATKQKQRDARARKARDAYLKNLSGDFPKAWRAVQKAVERGSGAAYDEARDLLVDLSEAYLNYASQKRFQAELKNFMAGHLRRKALIQRMVKAGIWKEK